MLLLPVHGSWLLFSASDDLSFASSLWYRRSGLYKKIWMSKTLYLTTGKILIIINEDSTGAERFDEITEVSVVYSFTCV